MTSHNSVFKHSMKSKAILLVSFKSLLQSLFWRGAWENLDKSQAGGLTLPRAPNIPVNSLLLASSSVIFFQRDHTFVGEWLIFNLTHQDFPHCLWLWLPGTMQTLAQKCIISKSTRKGFYSLFSITISLGIQEVSLLLVTCLNFQRSIIHNSA